MQNIEKQKDRERENNITEIHRQRHMILLAERRKLKSRLDAHNTIGRIKEIDRCIQYLSDAMNLARFNVTKLNACNKYFSNISYACSA